MGGKWAYTKLIPKSDPDAEKPSTRDTWEQSNQPGEHDNNDDDKIFDIEGTVPNAVSIRKLRRALGLTPYHDPERLRSSAASVADAKRIMLEAADAAARKRGQRVVYVIHTKTAKENFFEHGLGVHMSQMKGFAGLVDTSPLCGGISVGEWVEQFGFVVWGQQIIEHENKKDEKKNYFLNLDGSIRLSHDGLMDALYTGKALAAYLTNFERSTYDPDEYVYIRDPNIIFISMDIESTQSKHYSQCGFSVATSSRWLQLPFNEWSNEFETPSNNWNSKVWAHEDTRPGWCIPPHAHKVRGPLRVVAKTKRWQMLWRSCNTNRYGKHAQSCSCG